MGCRFCTSGLEELCEGPLGLDDLEVACTCSCHECEECGSAYCERVGGREPCRSDEEDLESSREIMREIHQETWRPLRRGATS